MRNRPARKGRICIAAGALLIAAALCLAAYNLWDGARASASVQNGYAQLEKLIPTGEAVWQGSDGGGELCYPDYVLNPDMEMPVLELDGRQYIGTLEIPALGLTLPVLSEWSYPNLKIAPCRYTGSAYREDLILAAHNYASHFGGLQDLAAGDEVHFVDADGNRFRYTVAATERLGAAAVEEMQSGDWALTLFTCTVGGQYRVAVRCARTTEMGSALKGEPMIS